MTLSSKTCLVAVVTVLAVQPVFAGGRMGGGNFSRPAFRQPAIVSRTIPTRNLGNFQTLNPTGGVQNGNLSGVVRNNQLGNVVPPSSRLNSNLTTINPHLIAVDPSVFQNIRRNPGTPVGGGSTGNPGSPTNTITVPPGYNKHIDPLPGERPMPFPPPAPGNTNPGNGTGSGVGDLLGNLGSLLSGGGSSGAAAGGGEEAPAAAPAPAADPVASTPAESKEAPAKDVLDVELTDVRLIDAGSLERKVGPRYRLYYRNAGSVEVPKFHVSVAVDIGEKLTEKAELVTVEAVGLKPGKTQTVDVRLPVEVLKMTIDYEGRPVAFNSLVALIDSDDDLAESNEKNNILAFSRDKIQSVK